YHGSSVGLARPMSRILSRLLYSAEIALFYCCHYLHNTVPLATSNRTMSLAPSNRTMSLAPSSPNTPRANSGNKSHITPLTNTKVSTNYLSVRISSLRGKDHGRPIACRAPANHVVARGSDHPRRFQVQETHAEPGRRRARAAQAWACRRRI